MARPRMPCSASTGPGWCRSRRRMRGVMCSVMRQRRLKPRSCSSPPHRDVPTPPAGAHPTLTTARTAGAFKQGPRLWEKDSLGYLFAFALFHAIVRHDEKAPNSFEALSTRSSLEVGRFQSSNRFGRQEAGALQAVQGEEPRPSVNFSGRYRGIGEISPAEQGHSGPPIILNICAIRARRLDPPAERGDAPRPVGPVGTHSRHAG